MKKITFISSVILLTSVVLMITSCAPALKVTGSWVAKDKVNAKKYSKLFIIALAERFEVKTQFEMNLAFAAVDRGLSVVKSTDIFPYTFTKDNIPNKEILLEKIKEAGCDAILTVVPLKKSSETRYVESSVAYTPMSYNYYGNFYHYYNYYTPIVYSEGYYTTDQFYFIESNFYDFATGDLLWSVQSEATNPASIETFSKEYTELLVNQLKKDGIGKK